MLHENDRRALEGIERRLGDDDPAFVLRMQKSTAGSPSPTVAILCLSAFLSLPFIALFFGPRATLISADVAAVAVVAILTRCHRLRTHDDCDVPPSTATGN